MVLFILAVPRNALKCFQSDIPHHKDLEGHHLKYVGSWEMKGLVRICILIHIIRGRIANISHRNTTVKPKDLVCGKILQDVVRRSEKMQKVHLSDLR